MSDKIKLTAIHLIQTRDGAGKAKDVQPGEVFEASEKEAATLIALGAAKKGKVNGTEAERLAQNETMSDLEKSNTATDEADADAGDEDPVQAAIEAMSKDDLKAAKKAAKENGLTLEEHVAEQLKQ